MAFKPSITARIKRIQKHLRLTAGGLIGPATLTALENELFGEIAAPIQAPNHSLTVSQGGLKQLVRHEISSASYYRKRLTRPVWPGGSSGVTIGIGYDLGAQSKSRIKKDWRKHLPDRCLELLLLVSGKSGKEAKRRLGMVKAVTIPLEAAEEVFFNSTLPRYAAMALKAYPELNKLHPGAQAAILSLVYNRGTRKSGGSRREMKAIAPLVLDRDYEGIAAQITSMKRLWRGKNLPGLLKRRDHEAALVLQNRSYRTSELVRV